MIKRIDKILVLYIVAGVALCTFIVLPFFHAGFFPTHDGEWAVVRAAEMFRQIRDLQFPPRYSGALNFGYGYPLFNFAYPFPYYITTLFHAFSLSFIDSVKAVFVLSTYASFFSMFALSNYFWKSKLAGFVSAMLYLFLPYRMVDLYARGSIGETLAFALYPLILIFMLLLLDNSKKRIGIFGTALCIGVLALTHNISAVYFGIIILAFVSALLWVKKYKEVLYLVASVAWGGLLASFFVFPALYERQNIRLSKIPIADRDLYFVTIPKLFLPSWGYGTPTDSNPFPYSLGIPQSIGFVLSLFAVFKTKDVNKAILISFSIAAILMILAMFQIFGFLWKMPLLSEINYPWTLLLPLGFLMAFLSGAVVRMKFGMYLSLALVVLAVFLTYSYAKPESYVNYGDEYYITNEGTTTSSQELMPLWVKELPTERFVEKVNAELPVQNLAYTSDYISFSTSAPRDSVVSVNQIYYPGWKAFVNGSERGIFYNNPQGIMQIQIPEGENIVEFKFTETKMRGFFDILSLIAFVVLMGFGLRSVYKLLLPKHIKKSR